VAAFNRTVDGETAQEIGSTFMEVIVAPGFEAAAVEELGRKKALRLLDVGPLGTGAVEPMDLRKVVGGLLYQDRDLGRIADVRTLRVVSQRTPASEEYEALAFAWKVAKHTKSNAIVYARADRTVGVGAGQMSRVDSVKLGAMKAVLPLAGTVIASDAFFPFRDGIDEAAKAGVTAVIQPGGSVKDDEVIAAADEHGMAMVLTGMRHFRH
jgi:phosphoribosylaminoimidazolecarboxamide formyltransferase/IMP cyclohydrolase